MPFLGVQCLTWCSFQRLFLNVISNTVYIDHIFFIHSSVDGHLGCFHVLALVNSAAMNIGMHVSFQIRLFSGYMPRSGITGSYSKGVAVLKPGERDEVYKLGSF